MRWIQDFRMKTYANPAKLESIDGKGFTVGQCAISIYQESRCFLELGLQGRMTQKRHKTCVLRGSPGNYSCLPFFFFT